MLYILFVIVAVILFIWVFFMRFIKKNKVDDAPLGLPKGTIRATLSLYLITFAFGYLLVSEPIPSIIISSVFVVMAFYFEKRSDKRTTEEMFKKIKNPEKIAKIWKPLYLPKYSVRITLLTILTTMIIYNKLGPDLVFVSSTTLLDLFVIIVLFIFGMIIGGIGTLWKKRRLKKYIKSNPNISLDSLLEKFPDEEDSSNTKGNSLMSMLTYVAIVTSIVFFIIDFDWTYDLILFTFSLRQTLMFMLNVYFGFRT
jgi:uncharacterized protein YneF (UPF0154 family)